MDNILIPVFAHVLWCASLYALLTVARAPGVWGIGWNASGNALFENVKQKVSANLSNQFEWPMFFHVLCVVLYTSGNLVNCTMLALAWVFVVGRVIHSLVQIFGTSVRLRGIVFTINFVAVLAMWLLFLADTVQ